MNSRPKGLNPTARLACLCVLVSAGLGGCNLPSLSPQAGPPTVEVVPAFSPEPIESPPPGAKPIVFWEPFALDHPQGLLLSEMVRDFEVENPDISIEMVPKSGYESVHEAMLAGLSGGELPDLAVAFPSMIAEYATAGLVEPLDPYLADPEIGLTGEDLADLYPNFLEAGRLPGPSGQLVAFPFVENAVGMWVNDTLLAQAGWEHTPATWEEFEQACFDVMATTGMRCYPFVESVSTFTAWLYSRGGRLLDLSRGQAIFNGPAGVESLALLRRLIDAGLAWRPEGPYGDYEAFARGEAAFTFSSTGNIRLYTEAYTAALHQGVSPFEWRQAQIPQVDPNRPSTLLYGAGFFIVPDEEERQRVAWRFIRWFTKPSQTARWAGGLDTLPVRASALALMTETLEIYPFLPTQVEEIGPYARSEPAIPAELEIRDILYTAILSVTLGYADPQTALDQAAQAANTVLREQP